MITAASSTTAAQSTAAQPAPQSPLDRNAFLKLLVTQLGNQDPLKPMDDTQFISQLAQFSSLEQMSNMNTSLSSFIDSQALPQAVSMIGHTIKYVDADTGATVSDQVKSVKIENGVKLVTSNGAEVPINYVIGVE